MRPSLARQGCVIFRLSPEAKTPVIELNDLVDAGEVAIEGVDRTDDSLADRLAPRIALAAAEVIIHFALYGPHGQMSRCGSGFVPTVIADMLDPSGWTPHDR